jgi:hypothetical protein
MEVKSIRRIIYGSEKEFAQEPLAAQDCRDTRRRQARLRGVSRRRDGLRHAEIRRDGCAT